ncbi:MAG: CRISPR-associated helicase Cas3' [Thermotogota bacterium]|nr:CRISPR-associated helicase Cas3' [Thermotogota bacterium]
MTLENIIKTLKGNSHPEKALSDHLYNCLHLSEQIKAFHNIDIEMKTEILTHDVAKEHPQFQKHLKNKAIRFPHSEPSSYLTFLLTQNILSAEVVRRHHGSMENFENAKSFWLSQAAESMNETVKTYAPSINIPQETLDKTETAIDDLLSQDTQTLEDWYTLRMKASILATADRMEAIGVEQIPFTKPVINQTTEQFIQQLPTNILSQWRNDTRKQTLEQTDKIKEPGIYTLSLPTGSGKTLIGLEIANQLKAKTIIYALPFISIIDQNAKIANHIYKDIQEDHHQAQSESGESSLSTFVEAFRYWISPVIITTFVSLWNAIYSPRYNATMNFHRLKDSVIILDEVQTLPPQCWQGFLKTMEFLAKKMNITVIMMTATQPSADTSTELSNNIFFPGKRHTYRYIHETNLNAIIQNMNPKKNNMFILNTRKSALKAYLLAQNQLETPFFLSKWIIPRERKQRIETIKKREKHGKQRNLITTQLVEAGVDLDFDAVIRDMAPLDCIVQSGGRCNRNMKNPLGTITICELLDHLNRPYTGYVYDKILLNVTKDLLNEYNDKEIDEHQMNTLLKDYYRQIQQSIVQSGPWEAISTGKWGEWFPLIQKRVPEATVIVDIDGEMKILLDTISELPKGLASLNTKRNLWKKIGEAIINVPKKEIDQWEQAINSGIIDDTTTEIYKYDEWIYTITPIGIGTIYTPEAGFIPYDMIDEIT